MVDYKIIKYCRLCRKRFIVKRGQAKIIYCEDCQRRMQEEHQAMEELK